MDQRTKLTILLKNKYPKTVYIKIFEILKNDNHSVNNNGIFFNLEEINDEKIASCIEFIENIKFNIEDHMKNLNLREEKENKFKTEITRSSTSQTQKRNQDQDQVNDCVIKKKEYKGVFKRIDRVLRGLKIDEKNLRKVEEPSCNDEACLEEDIGDEEENGDEEVVEDLDDDRGLFGDDSDCESISDKYEK